LAEDDTVAQSMLNAGLERKFRKERRELRKSLQLLSDAILLHLDALDNECSTDKTIPRETSKRIAKLANWLDMENDKIRYSMLGVDFRKDDKTKVVCKLMRSNK
jgi:hypothetical protein